MQDSLDPHEGVQHAVHSGTTGFPKGVMLTHYNVVNNGKCIGDCMDLTTRRPLPHPGPMFHCFGMVLSMTSSVTHGTTMSPSSTSARASSPRHHEAEDHTAMNGVPTMFIALLEHADFGKTDFSHMRTGIMAGSPCPVPVMEAVLDKMGMRDITIVFGQTESSPGCTQSRVGDPVEVRVATGGAALARRRVRIVDPATNQECPTTRRANSSPALQHHEGILQAARGDQGRDRRRRWVHTGDLALRTARGQLQDHRAHHRT